MSYLRISHPKKVMVISTLDFPNVQCQKNQKSRIQSETYSFIMKPFSMKEALFKINDYNNFKLSEFKRTLEDQNEKLRDGRCYYEWAACQC